MDHVAYPEVMDRVAAALAGSGRRPDEVTVVAVSKTMTTDQISEIYAQGHRDFGENRADEMEAKAAVLPGDIRWHFVGSLQSIKARNVRGITYLLHSMDRPSLGKAWMKGHGSAPPVLAEVNLGDEPQKSGVAASEVEKALEWMLGLGLDVRGLMAIPPVPQDPEDSRPHFAELRQVRDRLVGRFPHVTELSMGMTDDFEVGISEGASIIRVGRAIFGPRTSTGA